MKKLIYYINESISKSTIEKAVKAIKLNHPDMKPEELRDRVFSTMGVEAIANNKKLVAYIDSLLGIKPEK